MIIAKKILPFIACLCFSVVLISCSSTNNGKKFTPVEKGFLIKKEKTLAVLSGRNEDNDIDLTESIIKKISENRNLKVITQSKLKEVIPKYPLNINIVDFNLTSQNKLSSCLSNSSKSAVDVIHKLVKSDYILLVWIDDMTGSYYNGSFSTSAFVATRLISYPEGEIVAYSGSWYNGGEWDSLVKKISKDIVHDINKNIEK